jgi:hypothetical protein
LSQNKLANTAIGYILLLETHFLLEFEPMVRYGLGDIIGQGNLVLVVLVALLIGVGLTIGSIMTS